jgi:cobyrinic acid a,c-diamide synthase
MVNIARVVIAAPASGNGKTSVATGLLAAFRARGLTVSPHKVGPDYIDPGYHTLAAGRPGRNLDPWLVGEALIGPLFVHGARTPVPADIAIIEGVMGLFDGARAGGDFASTAHVARLLQAPIVLVIDASGAGRSVAALLHGFVSFDPTVRIGGVIFNQVGSPGHAAILREAVEPMGVPVLGTVFRHDSLAVPSRHLGLIPAAERSVEAQAVVAKLGAVITESIDLDAVLRLARSAPELRTDADLAPESTTAGARVRIALAAGPAFTFGYAEHPELLAAAGAEVVPFDPTRDESLPAGVSGLVIGGGFPEVHAVELSANAALRSDIAALARSGAPIAAECAGLLYLSRSLDGHPMCGLLDVDAAMGPRLSLGYRDAVAPSDSVLVAAGTRVHGHEFHRTLTTPGSGTVPAWQWRHDGVVSEGFVQGSIHASYLHLHWSGVPGLADRFVSAARAYQESPR